MKPNLFLAAAGVFAIPFAVHAQAMKPGLWEINNKMQMGEMNREMAQMQQQMASMPAEQRKMMEDMMAKQGLSLGAGGGPGAVSVRICMTREMAERDQIPAGREDCKNTVAPRSGNRMKFAFSCANPPSSGEGQATFVSPEHYTMNMTLNTVAQGKPDKMSMEGSGKWLSADCGAVKPMPMTTK